jgi:hypothetical protein
LEFLNLPLVSASFGSKSEFAGELHPSGSSRPNAEAHLMKMLSEKPPLNENRVNTLLLNDRSGNS